MSAPRTLIVRTAGTNCDRELAYAFELAGARTQTVHLNRLIAEPRVLEDFDLIGFPGGFSYGDDIAAGRIFANRLRRHLLGPLREAIGRGMPMIGVCNGFQVLVKLGLLPFPDGGPDGDGQTATLTDNTAGRFVDRWSPMEADAGSSCVWTRGLGGFELPIAHGEGRFMAEEGVLQRLRDHGQVALRYARGHNPNGSADRIAGVCDPSGLVLGLMPHPERFVVPTQHPAWTRQGEGFLSEQPSGLRMIRNAVEHAGAAHPTAASTAS